MRVNTGDAGEAADAVDDAADRVPVDWPAAVGDQPPVGADVFEVRRRPLAEQVD